MYPRVPWRGAGPGSADRVDHGLVGGHHDGRVGDLPHEVGAEAAVEADQPLLAAHRGQRAPEGGVLGARLPQPRPRHLVRVGHRGRHTLAHAAAPHHHQEVRERPLVPRRRRRVALHKLRPHLGLCPFPLQLLVDDEVHDGLDDAVRGGGHPAPEAEHAALPVDGAHNGGEVGARPPRLQLHPRLDDPERVGGAGGHEAGRRRGQDVHPLGVGRQHRVQVGLDGGVGPEVDSSAGGHTCRRGGMYYNYCLKCHCPPNNVGPSPLKSPLAPSCITIWESVDQILE